MLQWQTCPRTISPVSRPQPVTRATDSSRTAVLQFLSNELLLAGNNQPTGARIRDLYEPIRLLQRLIQVMWVSYNSFNYGIFQYFPDLWRPLFLKPALLNRYKHLIFLHFLLCFFSDAHSMMWTLPWTQ